MTVTVDRFGKDHWSLLAYVETLCVDSLKGIGTIDHRRMRCNIKTHPALRSGVVLSSPGWKSEWGTQLKGYIFTSKDNFLPQHDDWDCLDDLDTAGFIETLSLVNGFVTMTGKGNKTAAQLREHKTKGGRFANFEPVKSV